MNVSVKVPKLSLVHHIKILVKEVKYLLVNMRTAFKHIG